MLSALAVGAGAVLVVDDDAEVNRALALLLQLEGYHVHRAFNGAEALRCLHEGVSPSVIVLDLQMPVMDGRECLRALADDPEWARLPVIIYSADPLETRTDAVIGHVPKGHDPIAILDLVAAACSLEFL